MLATATRTSFAILGPSGSDRGYEHRPPRAPWLMVPRTESRSITLSLYGGHPVTIRNADDQGNIRSRMGMPLCRVRVVGNQLVIEGLRESRDIPIDLVHRGRELRVMVTIKNRRTLPIVAHFVEHGPLLRTRMTSGRLKQVMEQANAFLGQANVRLSLAVESVLAHERLFRPDPAGPRVSPKRSLGRIVKNNDELDLLTRHRITPPSGGNFEYAALNVFFARDVELGDRAPGDPTLANAFTDFQGDCFFGDYTGPGRELVGVIAEGRTLAHEAVHHLLILRGNTGDHHVASDPYNLMAGEGRRFPATRLTREQIETINATLAFKP